MTWKIILLFLILGVAFGFTAYIVWNNRSSEKILLNFATVSLAGVLGLLATALITLKEEKITDTYSSCIFIQRQPFYLLNYNVIMKIDRKVPITFVNNAIENLLKKDSVYFDNIFPVNNNQKWKLFEDLYIRYMFDVLDDKYQASWYLRSYELRVPGGRTASSWPVEQLDYTSYNDENLSKVFPENDFIKIGRFTDLKDNKNNSPLFQFALKLPPDTKILYEKDTLNTSSIQFDNDFVNIEIKFKSSMSVQNIDEDVARAYKIDPSAGDKFFFLPFLVETTTTYKKFKIGHPEMEKYKYWATDMLSYLKGTTSIDEFWKQVEANQ